MMRWNLGIIYLGSYRIYKELLLSNSSCHVWSTWNSWLADDTLCKTSGLCSKTHMYMIKIIISDKNCIIFGFGLKLGLSKEHGKDIEAESAWLVLGTWSLSSIKA